MFNNMLGKWLLPFTFITFRYIDVIIDFPKPLIAVVNGPAIGVGVTSMALYDAAYASDKVGWVFSAANVRF